MGEPDTSNEDFEIAEQIQRGLPTGANTHVRFARFEGADRLAPALGRDERLTPIR